VLLCDLLPEVQAVGVVVDVFGVFGVELDDGFVVGPEHLFDEAHFVPSGAAVFAGDGDVFPAEAALPGAGGDDFKGPTLEVAVVLAGFGVAEGWMPLYAVGL